MLRRPLSISKKNLTLQMNVMRSFNSSGDHKEVLSNVFQNTTAMKVSLTDTGKRFNRDWIFRHLTYTFEEGQSYAIIGPNGSGKSTLLQVISGSMLVNEGNIQWSNSKGQLANESVYNQIAIS